MWRERNGQISGEKNFPYKMNILNSCSTDYYTIYEIKFIGGSGEVFSSSDNIAETITEETPSND